MKITQVFEFARNDLHNKRAEVASTLRMRGTKKKIRMTKVNK
jgi:hypothetical protein